MNVLFLGGEGEFTPRKTNVSLENECLENVCPIEIVPFMGHSSVFED